FQRPWLFPSVGGPAGGGLVTTHLDPAVADRGGYQGLRLVLWATADRAVSQAVLRPVQGAGHGQALDGAAAGQAARVAAEVVESVEGSVVPVQQDLPSVGLHAGGHVV